MLLKDFYHQYLYSLKQIYTEGEAAAICNLVFEHFAKADKKFIIRHPEYLVDESIANDLNKALIQLKTHTPVQYVLGETIFYNLNFSVTPAVLIPRPETEELVTAALHFITENKKQTLLDVGTGSGCIPVSIKKNYPGINVTALEFSISALHIARENGMKHEVQIDWQLADFLAERNWINFPCYDVITSNPPYIPLKEKHLLDKNVTDHEPSMALFVPDDDPLLFYKKIAALGKNHLNENGKIFMEVHENFAADVYDYFTAQGYEAAIIKDIFEKERIVTATRSR